MKLTIPLFLTVTFLAIGCGKTPEQARKEIAGLNLKYDSAEFASCIEKGDKVAIQLFLKSGIDVNGASGSPLKKAILSGDMETVRQLLAHGAKVEYRYSDGHSPLTLAAMKGDIQIVKTLVEQGRAAVEEPSLSIGQDPRKKNPLLVAADWEKREVLNYLAAQLGLKADRANELLFGFIRDDDPVGIKVAVASGADVNSADEFYGSPLFHAEQQKSDLAQKYLISVGATNVVKNTKTRTAEDIMKQLTADITQLEEGRQAR